MFLSHMDKDHPKNESRWSVYIHSGQILTRVKKSNFSINSKESQNWVKKYICFLLHTDRCCQTDWGNRQWESKSQSFSFFFCHKRRMMTDSDRQTKKLPVQKANKTSQIRMTTWKRKQNTSHSQFWSNWVEKKGWGGTGRGRERVRKRNAHVTTKWLIFCHYK